LRAGAGIDDIRDTIVIGSNIKHNEIKL